MDRTQLEQGYIPDGGEKVRLLTLDHLDGRTLAVKRVRQVEVGIAADLGGSLSEAQKALVRRNAVLEAILGDVEARWASGESLVLADYLSAIKVQRNVLLTLGIERRPRQVQGLPALLGRDD